MTGLALHPTANVWAEDQNNEIKADGVVEVHIYDIACSKNIAMSFLFLFLSENTILSAWILHYVWQVPLVFVW